MTLVAHTPGIEVLIATSMLTTTSGAQPSTLHERLLVKPEKVRDVVGRLEVQHGNVLEHNRLVWLLEAPPDEVMEAMLDNRFLTITRLGDDRWLMSCNMRTVAEYAHQRKTEFTEKLIDSVRQVAPTIYKYIQGGFG